MEGLGAEATSRPHTQDAAVCNGPAQASNSTTAAQALGGARTAEATCSEASLTTPRTATAAATPSVAIAARRQRVSIKSPRPTTTSLTAEPGGSLAAEGRTAHSGRDLPGRQRASPTRGPTFDMSGSWRLADNCPLDGGVSSHEPLQHCLFVAPGTRRLR